jgi:hypothetical protein
MAKCLVTCGLFVFILSVTVCYAATVNPCLIEKGIKKQLSKNTEKITPTKLPGKLPVKPESIESIQNQSSPAIKNSNPADTFESIIAPFLKAVTPHFYDQIIKREKSATANS